MGGTNILDLTHIPIPVEVRTNERGVHGPQINLYKNNNPLFSANYIQVLYGRENKTDKIYCDSEVMNWEVPDLKIESRGGQLSNPDVIKYCKNVVLTGFSDYQSSALIWGKRSIAIVTEGKPGHIHIGSGGIEATNRPSMQSIQFLDTALLKELRFYY